MLLRIDPLVLLVASLNVGSALAQTPQTYAEYLAAGESVKHDTLGRIASHRHTVPPGVLKAVLGDALADTRSEIRLAALGSVSGRAGGVRFKDTEDIRQRWREERQVLQSLRPQVLNLLDDPDERVRRDAVIAVVNLSYDVAADPKLDIPLPDEVLNRLLARYPVELSRIVRSEIMKTAALAGGDARIRSDLIVQGLNDREPGVLVFALMGSGRLKDPAALSRVVELVQHSDKAIRLAAASAIAEYGAVALPYLFELNAAVTVEMDDLVKKTLEGAIVVLTRRR